MVGIAVSARSLAKRAKAIALAHAPITGAFPAINEVLESYQFPSYTAYQRWSQENAAVLASWRNEDADTTQDLSFFTVPGFCAICGVPVDFEASNLITESGSADLNWREQLTCPRCQFGNRIRAALHLSLQEFSLQHDSNIYVTEQFGRVYRWLRGHFENVQGSEYLKPRMTPGSRSFGITHEDVQALSLTTSSVDFIITFDVMEHVPDPQADFESFARVLAPGGRLIMTAPFTVDKFDTTVRATMDSSGNIDHLLPPEIHGNPTDPAGGALCFRHFGWDVLQQLAAAGFDEARVVLYHDRRLGYLGGAQSLITAVCR